MAWNGNSSTILVRRILFLRDFFEKSVGKDKHHAVRMEEIKDAYLKEIGVRPATNTVYNDIGVLQSAFGMDIEYLPRHGYILRNPKFEPYELRMLIDCLQSSKFLTQKEADRISTKVKDYFTTETTRANLNRTSYVADRVRNMNDSVVKDADKIHAAITNDRQISFRYFHRNPDRQKSKKYAKEGSRITASPFALYWDSGNYYLYAYISETQRFRTFRVDRMVLIEGPLLEKREGSKEYRSRNLTNRKAVVFDAYQTDKVFSVKFRCHNHLADAIIDRFGEDTRLLPADDTHFTFTASIDVSPPFYAWIATFGRSIKILEPMEVVEGIKDFLQRSSDMYKD